MENINQVPEAKPTKKKKVWIVAAALVLVVLLAAGGGIWYMRCAGVYDAAIADWENGAYTQAAAQFDSIRGFKDAGEYMEQYEQMLTRELTEGSWISQMFHHHDNYRDYESDGFWEYSFSEGGQCLRSDHRRDDGERSYKVSGEYEATYTFVYQEGEVCVRIDTKVSSYDYVLKLEEDGDGVHVVSFAGMMQFYDDHYSTYTRQTPESEQ